METSIADRLKLFIDHTGLNNSQFAEKCGIPKPSLSQILSGRNKKVSNQFFETLHLSFPELNILWLIFGEGSMFGREDFPSNPFESESMVRSEPMAYYGGRPVFDFAKSTEWGTDDSDNSNVRGLNAAKNRANTDEEQRFSCENKMLELQMQIDDLHKKTDKFEKNPRRVVQITVYYDDSTFETFKAD